MEESVRASGNPEPVFVHLGEITATERRKILAEIKLAVAVANLRPFPRLTAIRDELGRARQAVSENGTLPAFSDEAQTYLEAIEPGYRDLMHDQSLLGILDEAIRAVKADVASAGQHKGGRHSDGRVRRFVNILAGVYETATGKAPTHIVDSASGSSTSPFNLFVLECFRQFWPGSVVPQAAIREAMRLTLRSRLEEPQPEASQAEQPRLEGQK